MSRKAVEGTNHMSGRCSFIEWSSSEEHVIVVATQDCNDSAAIKVWDMRNLNESIDEFCYNSKGMLHSLGPLLTCTENDKIMLWDVKCTENDEIMRRRVKDEDKAGN
ncbi:hypothetical protein ABZP36_021729 [Zizania latifolia]